MHGNCWRGDDISSGWIRDVLTLVDGVAAEAPTWWGRYGSALAGSLTPRSIAVVEADCRYILEKGINGAGPPGTPDWPASKVRSGLVMGAVQSGKTASMMGVIAMALDKDVDIVLVLAGTRLSLWRQTYDRLKAQLDIEPDFNSEGRRRTLLPGQAAIGAETQLGPAAMYQITRTAAARVMNGQTSLLAVVMKNDMHLQALAREIRESFGRTPVDRPLHMLVVDDEADDGSILEPTMNIDGPQKQIPRSITQLWKPGWQGASQSFWDRLHVTYLAYTATPQANLLQSDFNVLSPKDFLAALRTPGIKGSPESRELTFREPLRTARYVGGQDFYHNHSEHLIVQVPSEHDPLGDALRSFFVAGAFKILADPTREHPRESREKLYLDRSTAKAMAPRPHTMLIHPSARVADHFRSAAEVLSWTRGLSHEGAEAAYEAGQRHVDASFLAERLKAEEERWREWHSSFIEAQNDIAASEGLDPADPPLWGDVMDVLVRDVFPYTDVAVVNSDPDADERPAFSPERVAGGWRAARNLSTIFVAGNVMSRGLTLEGLTTTIFNRTSNNPLADTQMQMQRWFGYRGKDLHVTRLFIDEAQLNLFVQYHETDVALRLQILRHMDDGGVAPTPAVFEGPDFKATGKVPNLRHLPLHPGKSVYLSGTNGADDPNNAVVAKIFQERDSTDAVVGGRLRGRMLIAPLSARESAETLESLTYVWRTDTLDEYERQRWEGVERMLQTGADVPLLRLHSKPGIKDPESLRAGTPYSIAAYLRLWSEVAQGRSRGGLIGVRGGGSSVGGLTFTDPPYFNVAIRYGDGGAVTEGSWRDLPFVPVATTRALVDGLVKGGWGSRNPHAEPGAYAADEYFDYHARGTSPPAWNGSSTGWRPAGDDGLILFQLTEVDGAFEPAVSVGVVMPLGGPNQYPVYIEESST